MPDGTSHNAFVSKDQPTLQWVLEQISDDVTLPSQRRRNLCSAIRGLGKLMERPLHQLPAHPQFYRDVLSKLHPEHCGFSEGRIRNIKSDVRFALRHTGCIGEGHTYMAPFTEEWQLLWDAAASRNSLRRYISRLMHFCSANRIAPNDVNDTVSQAFLTAMVEESFIKNPVKTHRDIVRLWNKAVSMIPVWPQQLLKVPSYKETYTIPLTEFPEPFQAEVNAMFDRWAGKDLLDDEAPVKPMKPRTIKSRRYRLRQIMTGVVRSGTALQDITSLSQIVEIDVAKAALRFHLDRKDGKTSTQIHSLAILIKVIANHWVGVDEGHLEALKQLCKKVEPKQEGLTEKNRERLRQFNDDRNVALLLGYPERIAREASKRNAPLRGDAIDLQIALAVEILTMAPIRAANLVGIEIDRHIVRTRRGRKGIVHLVIPGTETKNGEPLEFELTAETVRLIDLYLDRFHPLLTETRSRYLFPGVNGGHKGRELLGDQISKRVFKATGLRVNLHLFRHIAAKLYLDRHPGGYEVVRRLLGHKTMESTVRFYAGLETAAAGKHFDETILKLRDQSRDIPKRGTG